jgi:C1A family cysteine protease
LREAVSQQPISVAIEADSRTFQLYTSGVITSESCGTNLDHGVLVVGYGEEDGIAYWLVKNSWGDSWGDNGYVKIERSNSTSSHGTCGIAIQPSYPSV